MKLTAILCLGVCVYIASACANRSRLSDAASTPSKAATPKIVRYDGVVRNPFLGLGTFHVAGTIERLETVGKNYEYVVRSTLTLNTAGGNPPATGVYFTRAVLTASMIDNSNPPSLRRVLHSERRTIEVTFTRTAETRTLPEVRFHLLKSIEAQADYITLDLTNGHLVLPLALDLKRQFR